MTTPDPTKLADWMPILQLPEVGERVCRAAGVRVTRYGIEVDAGGSKFGIDFDQTSFRSEPAPALLAALAHGGSVVLEQDRKKDGSAFSRYVTACIAISDAAFDPAAVLAALYRVYGPFGDGG